MRRTRQQLDFFKTRWSHRYSHGGKLRKLRAGRGPRPLARKTPIHLVLKADKTFLRTGLRTYRRYFLILKLLDKYSRKFFIKVEQISIQHDHIHLLIRAGRRSNLQNFFRVFSGQIAQQFALHGLVTDTPKSRNNKASSLGLTAKLWKYRPFTRVVKGWKAYRTVRNYIELNEHEAMGRIYYQAKRLKGLSSAEWNLLWS